MKSLASDNYAGVHATVLEAISQANVQHAVSYGDDPITERTKQLFASVFGPVEVLFTFNGTGANVIALKCCTLSFEAILCAASAHIHVDECGAPVQSIGCTLIPIETPNGKLTPALIRPFLSSKNNVHNNQPKVISISQSTELGTVYSLDELRALSAFARENDLFLHMDGARIANAAVSLRSGLKECTVDCGVDIMSFGGTKNGLLFGEAILIFNENLKKNARFYHKQSAQLFSKNRFISVQFEALLCNNLWRTLASQSNAMAQLLASEVKNLPKVEVVYPVESNAVFVTIPQEAIQPLQSLFPFYVWNNHTLVLRWMCSFDTTESDILGFTQALKRIIDQLHT